MPKRSAGACPTGVLRRTRTWGKDVGDQELGRTEGEFRPPFRCEGRRVERACYRGSYCSAGRCGVDARDRSVAFRSTSCYTGLRRSSVVSTGTGPTALPSQHHRRRHRRARAITVRPRCGAPANRRAMTGPGSVSPSARLHTSTCPCTNPCHDPVARARRLRPCRSLWLFQHRTVAAMPNAAVLRDCICEHVIYPWLTPSPLTTAKAIGNSPLHLA